MENLVPGKIITTKVFVFLDNKLFRYYIFSDWHCSFVKRNKKVLHSQCTASPANNSHCQKHCDNEATTDLRKIQVCKSKTELENFYRNLREERFTFVKQIFQDLHFVFERLYVWQRVGISKKIIKQHFETMRQHTLNN